MNGSGWNQDGLNSFTMDDSGWIEPFLYEWIRMNLTVLLWMHQDGLKRFAMDGSGWIEQVCHGWIRMD